MNHQRLLRDRVFRPMGYPIAAEQLTVVGDISPHSHDFLEIAVVVGGSGTHLRDGEKQPLRAGQVFAVRPGQWHGYRISQRANLVNFYLGQELLGTDLGWVLDHPDLAKLLLHGGRSSRPIAHDRLAALIGWVDALASVQPLPGSPSAGLALGLGSCVLAEIATATVSADEQRPMSPVVRRALRLLGDDLAHPWQMTELATEVGVSAPHLHRLFAAEVGLAPMSWLARSRVERATALLMTTDLPVMEIGRHVGWPDPSYFSRRFRSQTGLSPTRYRTELAGDAIETAI